MLSIFSRLSTGKCLLKASIFLNVCAVTHHSRAAHLASHGIPSLLAPESRKKFVNCLFQVKNASAAWKDRSRSSLTRHFFNEQLMVGGYSAGIFSDLFCNSVSLLQVTLAAAPLPTTPCNILRDINTINLLTCLVHEARYETE